jgi:hypothetical protein
MKCLRCLAEPIIEQGSARRKSSPIGDYFKIGGFKDERFSKMKAAAGV